MSIIASIINGLGLATLLFIIAQIAEFFYTLVLPVSEPLGKYKLPASTGTAYALITGASNGAGFGFANELASRGFNLILLSRSTEKLETAKTKILNSYPKTKIEIVTADVLETSAQELANKLKPIIKYPITILVNNVGGFPTMKPASVCFDPFTELQPSMIEGVVQMNAIFTTHITHQLLHKLSKNNPGGRSLIVNVSSGVQYGFPRLVPYSAAKGYVATFTKALHRECRGLQMPVDVISVTLADVQSNSNTGPVRWDKPSSATYAYCTFERVSNYVALGKLEMAPYIPHSLIYSVMGILPEIVLGKGIYSAVIGTRKKFIEELKKQ